MTPTVAVTGATGFVGSHVVQALTDAGWAVRILARRLPNQFWLADVPVETIIGDLDDEASLRRLIRGCEAVVHAAGLIKARSTAEFLRINRDGVARLAALAAAAEPPPRFVLLSSLAAREPQLSPYASSKHAGEQALAALGGALHWTILRPPAIYGPGDRETLAFFRAVAGGIGPLAGSRDNRMSLAYVGDVAAAVAAVLAAPAATAGAIYEVGDPAESGHSWRELIELAGRLLGTRPRLLRIPQLALSGAAKANWLLALLTGRPRMLVPGKLREIQHPDWVCRNDLIFRSTGWRPATGLETGFTETIVWYRSAGWL